MRTKFALFSLGLLAVTGLLGGGMMDPAMAQTPAARVALSAKPSLSSYTLGQPVTINITLTNQSGAALGLSSLIDGNIAGVTLTRDGGAVNVRQTTIDYEESLDTLLGQSLRTVANGGTLSTSWESSNDSLLGGQSLQAVGFKAADHEVTLFDLSFPGTYKLSFYYQYPAPTAGLPGTVYTGRTNTVTVSFKIN